MSSIKHKDTLEKLCSRYKIRQLYALPEYSLFSDEFDFVVIADVKQLKVMAFYKELLSAFKNGGRITIHNVRPYCDKHNQLIWDNGVYVGPEVC